MRKAARNCAFLLRSFCYLGLGCGRGKGGKVFCKATTTVLLLGFNKQWFAGGEARDYAQPLRSYSLLYYIVRFIDLASLFIY